ncbi:MAG: MerC domain-containing protein [Bryobacterales bacterium]|nr:MerC domain-containing protein [Bryobacterales bacterium]
MRASITPDALLDRLGIVVSGLCAIHCLAMPLLLGALPAAGLWWAAGNRIESVILILACALASLSLVPAYFRHRNSLPIQLFAIGSVFLGASRLASPGPSHWFCALGLAMGGGLIAAAHFRNARLRSFHGLNREESKHA